MIEDLKRVMSVNNLEDLQEIMECIPSAIVVFRRGEDQRLSKLYSNGAAKKLVGTKPRQLVSQEELMFTIHPEDRERMTAIIAQNTAAHRGMDETYRLLDREGRPVWVHHVSYAQPQSDGSCLFYAVLTDVTQQRIHEEEKKVERFRRYSAYKEKNFDLKDLKSAHEVIDLQGAMLRSIANMYVVMYLCDLENNTFVEIYAMDHVKKLFGNVRTTSGVLELVVNHFVHPDFREEARKFNDVTTLAERLRGKPVISMDYNATVAGWCRQQFIPVTWDENGNAREAICVEQRIQSERMQVENLRRLAEIDGMTQLFNRSSGAEYINKYLDEGSQGMFCLFDVDGFKRFNDQYGHQAGDKILEGISACMRETFRNVDILMRAGGDEFVIFALGLLDREIGQKKLDELCERVAALSFKEFHEKVQISIGTVFSDELAGARFDELFGEADGKMYQIKNEKKKKNNIEGNPTWIR